MGDESANVNVAYSDLIFRGVSILGFLLGRAPLFRSKPVASFIAC